MAFSFPGKLTNKDFYESFLHNKLLTTPIKTNTQLNLFRDFKKASF